MSMWTEVIRDLKEFNAKLNRGEPMKATRVTRHVGKDGTVSFTRKRVTLKPTKP